MKNISTKLLRAPFLLVFVLFCFIQCKKGESDPNVTKSDSNVTKSTLNVTLHDKSISNIQTYLQGRWRVHYMDGGICGTCRVDRDTLNEYLDFLPNNKVVYTFQNKIVADTTINWRQYLSPWNPLDTIKVFGFFDKRQSSFFREPYEIRNDTLIFVTPDHISAESNTWGATRSN